MNSIQLKENAAIRNFNFFKGPFKIDLSEETNIGKQNTFLRGNHKVSFGNSILSVGKGTRITSANHFDLTKSITFGEFSQVAGINTQFWTHGYLHADEGKERIRIDGEINIGNNVYIGSRCLINPGVTVANAINIGGNSVVSKDLLKSGMYVNQKLRYLENNIEKARSKFNRVKEENLIDEVYEKS